MHLSYSLVTIFLAFGVLSLYYKIKGLELSFPSRTVSAKRFSALLEQRKTEGKDTAVLCYVDHKNWHHCWCAIGPLTVYTVNKDVLFLPAGTSIDWVRI